MPQTALAVNDFAAKSVLAKYSNLTATTAGTQIKTGAGYFLGWNINIAGTGGANIFTLYGTSTGGTVIGVFSTAATTVPLRPNAITFKTGLFVVLTGTSTSGNVTIVYA